MLHICIFWFFPIFVNFAPLIFLPMVLNFVMINETQTPSRRLRATPLIACNPSYFP